MKDCNIFEQRLLGGIPYKFRYDTENTLRSFQESRIMLQLYSNALRNAYKPSVHDELRLIVVAFGSFGRLDGASNVSDYDILFLYDGNRDDRKILIIRDLIKDIIQFNKALSFDHRDEIEAETFDFDASPAYPVLSVNELGLPGFLIRQLQILTEGRAIIGESVLLDLKKQYLQNLGFANSVYQLNLDPLRDSLLNLKNEFCSNILGRLRRNRTQLTNRKVLKLFTLREFYYLSTLFSVAEVAIGISARICNREYATKILSSPSILKIASFSDSSGVIGSLLSTLAPEHRSELLSLVQKHVSTMENSPTVARIDPNPDSHETAFFQNIRTLTLDILKKYDSLLFLLHDLEFLLLIDPLEPDITNWMTFRQFQRILSLRSEMIDSSKVLAMALYDVTHSIANSKGCPALEDAQKTLKSVIDYNLELTLPII